MAASPRFGSALASNCPSDSCGAAGAAPPPSGFSGIAISYPGLLGSGGLKIAPAAMLSPRRHRNVNRMAPRILLISNESIAQRLREFQLAGPELAPLTGSDSRFAGDLATRISEPN